MPKSIEGIVHGRTIELAEDLGLGDGQRVQVQVSVVAPTRIWGEGLRRCAGALAEDWNAEDDNILEQIRLDRGIA